MSKAQAKGISGIFDNEKPRLSSPTITKKSDERKQTIFMMPATGLKQLDFLALEKDTTRQALLIEAVNDLFLKYKKPPIA